MSFGNGGNQNGGFGNNGSNANFQGNHGGNNRFEMGGPSYVGDQGGGYGSNRGNFANNGLGNGFNHSNSSGYGQMNWQGNFNQHGDVGNFQNQGYQGQNQGLPHGRFNVGTGSNAVDHRNDEQRMQGRFNNHGANFRSRPNGAGRGALSGLANSRAARAVVTAKARAEPASSTSQNADDQRLKGMDAAAVSTAAENLLPMAQQLVDNSISEKAKKIGRCFRCGFSGHVLADCTTLLCDYCEGTGHVDDDCHLLKMVKPQILVYGHAHDDLTFYEVVVSYNYRPKI